MPTRFVRLLVLAALLACAVFIAQPAYSAKACSPGGCGTAVCSDFQFLTGSYDPFDDDGFWIYLEAGNVITVSATPQNVKDQDMFKLYDGNTLNYAGPTSAPGTLTYVVPTTGYYSMGVANLGSSDGPIDLVASCSTGTPTNISFNDGRINKYVADDNQTATIYCTKSGGVEIYGFYNGKSYLALRVTKAEIAAVPEHPAQNTLIKEAHGIRLYRLAGGQLQVNAPPLEAGKGDYTFIWDHC
jgi:hypothetical protein